MVQLKPVQDLYAQNIYMWKEKFVYGSSPSECKFSRNNTF